MTWLFLGALAVSTTAAPIVEMPLPRTRSSVGSEFVRIRPGRFIMGSPETEGGRDRDERQHEVTLTHDYWLGTTEVTNGEWARVVGTRPSFFWDLGEDYPVENVTWADAIEYCNRLSVIDGYEPVYQYEGTPSQETELQPDHPSVKWNRKANGYRLPTESEWEYATRAGSTTAFPTGDIIQTGCAPVDPNLDKVGWHCGNSGGTAHPVKEKLPNAFGLYDVGGNVSEWTWDFYGAYPKEPSVDPIGPQRGKYHVIRGGCWYIYASNCRSSNRDGNQTMRRFNLGFRVARNAE